MAILTHTHMPGEDLDYGFRWKPGEDPYLEPDETLMESNWILEREDGEQLGADDASLHGQDILESGEGWVTRVWVNADVDVPIGRLYWLYNDTVTSLNRKPRRTKKIAIGRK